MLLSNAIDAEIPFISESPSTIENGGSITLVTKNPKKMIENLLNTAKTLLYNNKTLLLFYSGNIILVLFNG